MFQVKENRDGEIERFKARMVAKGSTQTFGVDTIVIFAPVAKFTSIRAVLSMAAKYGFMFHQRTSRNLFLMYFLTKTYIWHSHTGTQTKTNQTTCVIWSDLCTA